MVGPRQGRRADALGDLGAHVDAVAMQLGMAGTDAYLDQWEHGDEEKRDGSAREVAEKVAAELEARFAEFRDRDRRRA